MKTQLMYSLINPFRMDSLDKQLKRRYLDLDSYHQLLKKKHMDHIMGIITMQLHAQKWYRTVLDLEQVYDHSMIFHNQINPPRRNPLLFHLRNKYYELIESPIRMLNLRRSEMIESQIRMLNLRENLYIFFLIPLLAIWEIAPQQLLEFDPTIILNPDMMTILRKAILHEGCPSHEVSDLVVTEITQCTCGENPVYQKVAEEFHEKEQMGVANIEGNDRNRMFPLVLAISSAILLSLLHSQVFSQ